VGEARRGTPLPLKEKELPLSMYLFAAYNIFSVVSTKPQLPADILKYFLPSPISLLALAGKVSCSQ